MIGEITTEQSLSMFDALLLERFAEIMLVVEETAWASSTWLSHLEVILKDIRELSSKSLKWFLVEFLSERDSKFVIRECSTDEEDLAWGLSIKVYIARGTFTVESTSLCVASLANVD